MLAFGSAIHDRGFIVHNVTAKLPCNTSTATGVPGYAGCEDPSRGGKDVCNSIVFQDVPSPDVPPHYHWLLSVGVNPPLPPIECSALHDAVGCEAKGNCRSAGAARWTAAIRCASPRVTRAVRGGRVRGKGAAGGQPRTNMLQPARHLLGSWIEATRGFAVAERSARCAPRAGCRAEHAAARRTTASRGMLGAPTLR